MFLVRLDRIAGHGFWLRFRLMCLVRFSVRVL